MTSMRSTAFAAVLAGVVGCYDATPPQGAPCDPSAPACPAGQSCVLGGGAYECRVGGGTMPDARSVDAPDADPNAFDDDSDGVLNATDNCRSLANANQADEDADDLGDVCDPCPISSDNADGDADGVGNACDPNPTVGGEQLMLFEGFDAGVPTAWTASSGWTTTGGKLISTASGSTQNTLVTNVTSSPKQTMTARMQITGVVGGQSGGALGIVDRNDAGATTGVMCGGARGNGGFLAIVNAANGIAIVAEPHAFDIGTTFDLRFTRSDNNYACRDNLVPQTVSTSSSPGGSLIGLRNRVLSASFEWIMVVRSP